ncbi:MAG: hypothetical protein U0938_13355 [Thiobacillus sp.]|nr:hypothetical protein [Thiobacillus sp.]
MSTMTISQFGALPSRGASATAEFIAKQAQERRQKWLSSYTFGQQLSVSVKELHQIYQECSQANWDGYEAMPVAVETYELAYRFLEALPLGTSAPTLGAEPDGHIAFEWFQSPRRMLSVSISPEGDLHYAALLGSSTHYGTEPFYGEAPGTILDIIRRITAA